MRRTAKPQKLAIASIAVSTLFVIWLGVISTDANSQPSQSQAALLIVLATVFQLAGNYALSQTWSPHPQVKKQAVDQLEVIKGQVNAMKNRVELAVDDPSTKNARRVLGDTSVLLDVVLDQLSLSVKSWDDGSPPDEQGQRVKHATS